MDDHDTVPQGTISPNCSDIYTIGVNLPNQANAKGRQYAFSEQEIDSMADAYAAEFARGKFIEYRDEHSKDKPVGEIIALWRNKNGDMGCLGHISGQSNAGRSAINNAVLQFSGGMSAGLTTGVVDDTSMFIPVQKPVYRQLNEVSITSDPCFAGTTHIKYYSDDPNDVLEKVANLASPGGTSDPSRAIARLPAAFQSLPQIFADQTRQGRRFALPAPAQQGPTLNSLSESLANSRSAVSMMSTFFSRLSQNQKQTPGAAFGTSSSLSHFFVPASQTPHFSPTPSNFGGGFGTNNYGSNRNAATSKRSLRVVKTRFSKDVPDSIGPPEPEDLDTFKQYYNSVIYDSKMSAADPSVGTPNGAQAPAATPAPAAVADQTQAPAATPLSLIPQGVAVPVAPAQSTGAAGQPQQPAAAPAQAAPPAVAGANGQLPQQPVVTKEAKVDALTRMQDSDLDLTMASAHLLKETGLKSGKDVVELLLKVKRLEGVEADLHKKQKEVEEAKVKADEAKKIKDANEMKAKVARAMFEPYAKMDLSSSAIPKEMLSFAKEMMNAGEISDRLVTDMELGKVSEITTMARAFDEDQRSKENMQQQQAQWAVARSSEAQSLLQSYNSAMTSMGNASAASASLPQQSSAQPAFTQPQQQQQSAPQQQVDQSYTQQQQPQLSHADASSIQKIKTIASSIPDLTSGSVESCMKMIGLLSPDTIPFGSTTCMGVNPYIVHVDPPLQSFISNYGNGLVEIGGGR